MSRQPDRIIGDRAFYERVVDKVEADLDIARRADMRQGDRIRSVIQLKGSGAVLCSCAEPECDDLAAAREYFARPKPFSGPSHQGVA